jgi:hypothetical protein
MNTLKVQLADEHKELNKDEFNQLLKGLYGSDNKQIHTFNPTHPIMQHVYISQNTLFDSIQTMLYPGHALEIHGESNHCEFIVTK